MPDYAPESNSDVETYVRELTGYTDGSKLPQTAFDAVLSMSKLRLSNRTGSEDWYGDSGLGQALVFGTAILAKARAENYTVTNYAFGDQRIDVQGVGEIESLQLQQWATAVAEGIESSSKTQNSEDRLRNTTSYIGG
jgi:hypothetical protein